MIILYYTNTCVKGENQKRENLHFIAEFGFIEQFVPNRNLIKQTKILIRRGAACRSRPSAQERNDIHSESLRL